MKRQMTMALVAFSLVALQVAAFPEHLAEGFRPNLLLVALAWTALRRPAFGPFAAVFLGLVHDSFSGLYLGLGSFSFLLIYFYLTGLADRLYTDSPFLLVTVVFFSSLAHGMVTGLLLLLFTPQQQIVPLIFTYLLPQSLVNALAASVVANLGMTVTPERTT
jgi:rod shape-determining protein MreD